MAFAVRVGALWNRNVGQGSPLGLLVSVNRPPPVCGENNFAVYVLDRVTGSVPPVVKGLTSAELRRDSGPLRASTRCRPAGPIARSME